MTHPENQSLTFRYLRQMVEIKRESLKLAERIINEAIERSGADGTVKEAYLASIPQLSYSFASNLSNMTQMLMSGNVDEIERMYEKAEDSLRELKAMNKELSNDA